MPACVLCGADEYDEIDGYYFCKDCGTQSQEIRNEVEGEEFLDIRPSHFSQIKEIKKKTDKKNRQSKFGEIDFGKPWMTCEGIQCLLKAQVQALVKMGVNQALKEVVKKLWFQYLSKMGIAFTGATQEDILPNWGCKSFRDQLLGNTPSEFKSKKKHDPEETVENENKEIELAVAEEKLSDEGNLSKDDLKGSDGSDNSFSSNHSHSSKSDEESDESNVDYYTGVDYTKPKRRKIQPTRNRRGRQDDDQDSSGDDDEIDEQEGRDLKLCCGLTVVFTYLGLLILKEPITISDLIRFIARGHLPYYNVSKIVPNHMKFMRSDAFLFSGRPLQAHLIHKRLLLMTKYLEVTEIPEPNFFLIISKLILDLQLPAAIQRLAVSLVKACDYKPRSNFSYSTLVNCNHYYEEMAAAFIIVAMKLVYGLDGKTEKSGRILDKFLDVSKESLDCWNCIAFRLVKKKKLELQNNYPTCEDDLSYIKDPTNYALYCREEIFENELYVTGLKQKRKIARASMKPAREEYGRIFKDAVSHLEEGKPKDFKPLALSSFMFDKVSETEDEFSKDVCCTCDMQNSHDSTLGQSSNSMKKRTSQFEDQPYLIYFSDFSGLKVHDSYRFLLEMFARRILIRPKMLQDFVTLVEAMLFVD